MTKKLLSYDELSEHGVPFTRQHIARLERAGKFPKHVKIGVRRIGWVAAEIDAMIDGAIDARDAGNKGRRQFGPPALVSGD